jgi:hypothetical protein
MTYQAFSNCNPLSIIDEGCMRDFRIIIPENKYITQDDIYFNIEYTNINYGKIKNNYDECLEKIKSLKFDKNIDSMKEYKYKINELIDSTINNIEKEEEAAKERQTPLFIFQNIELFLEMKDNDTSISIARRMFSGLDEMITNGKLSITQLFPGIKFKYSSLCELRIRFQRAPIKNKCLKFECHYNLNDVSENESIVVDLNKKYKEFMIPAGFYTGNIMIEPDVKSFKMVPCVNFGLFGSIDNKDYIPQAERLIKKYYDILKLKYYKDGVEINESEFGNSPGLYHIELLNKDELVNENDVKNNTEFYSIDYKIICLC